MAPILLLKSNSHRDERGRFAPWTRISGREITGRDQAEHRAAAVEYARRHFVVGRDHKGPVYRAVHNHALNRPIGISMRGIKHTTHGFASPELISSIAALPDILEHAVHIRSDPDRYGDPNIHAWHTLAAPLQIGDRDYAARLRVREDGVGTLHYHHDLVGLLKLPAGPAPDAETGRPPPRKEGEPARSPLHIGVLRALFNEDDGEPLVKALPAGARWITVRPNGPGTEGHAVMIQPADDGSYRVIGGAGGKLNYLKLTGVRSEEEYASRAKENAKASREEKKRQAARDRAAGIAGAKNQARETLRLAKRAARDDFVKQVSAALGWKPEDTRFRHEDHQDVPQSELDRLEAAHFDKLFSAAEKAVASQRQRLLADADMRAEGGLAAVPLTPPGDPSQISVADLDPVESDGSRGLGFLPRYEERAAARGADPKQMQAEAAAASGKQPAAGAEKPAPAGQDGAKQDQPAAAEESPKELGAQIADELPKVREPVGPRVDPTARATAAQAMQLLRAQRELREKLKQVQARAKEIDKADSAGAIEPNAFVIEVDGKAVDEATVRGVEDELRTIRTRGFLNEAEKEGATSLGKHISVGAFNSLNSLALAAGGSALMDRSVVDVLGPEAAAQALAHRLATDLPPAEIAQVREAMGRFHVQHYMARSTEALEEARSLQEQASEISIGEAANGQDLAVAQELNQRRREMTGRAKVILAQALGEMETNAALVTALEKPKRDRINVSLGALSPADAIVRLRAIGLDEGDYSLERAGRSTILTVKGDAIGKLTAPIDRADLERLNGALSIMQGHEDEAGWLPAGVARRPDFGKEVPAGVAPRLARAFPEAPADIGQAVQDYIGGRAADGDAPADILSGLLAEDVIQRAGDRAAFMAAVNEVAPLYDADGRMIRADAHAAAFEKLADAFTERAYGGKRLPIHRQQLQQDEISAEALHRALAKHPEGPSAFKPVGDLSPQEMTGLRQVFERDFAKADPAGKAKRDQLAAIEAKEPERETDGLLGRQPNPDWTAWKAERDAAAQAASAGEMTWPRYVETMGSPEAAYRAMQDVVKGRVIGEFAAAHNRLRPAAPLRIGRTNIAGDLQHLDALDPEARERRLEQHRAMVDRLRNRVGGRYAGGSVADKVAAAREAEEAAAQSQMGLFGDEPAASGAKDAPLPENDTPLGKGERVTVGHAAERVLAGMAQSVGRNFKPGQPVNIFAPDMSGKNVARQRAIKLIDRNRRVLLGMGVGSGKTSISLAGFTHLKAQGKAKRGLFLVPSVVQGQFHGEALSLLEPGKFNWHANPGASREERIAALKDPKNDFNVVTHQAFRDDVLHLAAQQRGTTTEATSAHLSGLSPEERRSYIKDVLHREGIDHDYLAVDEGHNLLNRRGKEDSRMAEVIDGVADGMGTYVNMTADPVKNDASEVFDTLAKMDRRRYTDRDAFMRRYGVDTESAKDGLRREMARHYFTSSIPSGITAHRKEISVPLHPDDRARIDAVNTAAAAARLARMEGRVDIAAMKALSPGSFDGVPPEQHEKVAGRLQDAIGVVRDAALAHAINGRGKIEALADQAAARKGRPGVVFAHHLDRVQQIAERLKADGHRVITMTGANSSKEKDRIKRAFQRGDHDILVVSDAGAVGANLQKGKWLAQFDTPQTAMAQPLDAKVLTPFGWKLMGDIGVGDAVMTPGGDTAYVSAIFPQGVKDIFRVTFSDGSSTRCCSDHLWICKSRDDSRKARDWRIRTLDHLRRTMVHKEGKHRTRANYHIPLVGRLDFAADLPIPPYLMGALLGDGEFGLKHVSLAGVDPEIIARAAEDAAAIGARIHKVGAIQYRLVGDGSMEGFPARRPSPVLHAARRLGIKGGCGAEKFIPAVYLFASFDARLALLQGLMDTDGTVDKRNGYTSFCTTSRALVEGIMHLSQSLGGVASVGPAKKSAYRGKTGRDHWKVSVSLPLGVNPFSLPRKADLAAGRTQRLKMRRAIASIEPCGREEAKCILVDHPDHLYVTDGFIVTHNTHAQRNGRIDRIGQTEDVDLIDLVADHPVERRNRDRLARKYGLREIVTSPLDGLDDTGLAGVLNRIRAGKAEETASAEPAPSGGSRPDTKAEKDLQPVAV